MMDLTTVVGATPSALFDQASRVLPKPVLETVADGALTPVTDARARRFLDALALDVRYLVDVSKIDTTAQCYGASLSVPIIAGPGNLPASWFHLDGANAISAGCAEAGTVAVSHFASGSDRGIRPGDWVEVAASAEGEQPRSLLQRAEAEGAGAVLVRLRPQLPREAYRPRPTVADGRGVQAQIFDEFVSSSLRDLEALTETTSVPVVAGGVLRTEDARAAIECGARGILVSNDPARRVDGVVSAVECLGPIVDEVGGAVPVFVGGGLRDGIDIVRALAAGASAVVLTRPVSWAVAAAGSQGVSALIGRLQLEVAGALAMTGVPAARALSSDELLRVGDYSAA